MKTLVIDWSKVLTGTMSYMIGEHKINRDEYWNMTDAERQSLHDKYKPGSTAIPFDPKFAWKHKQHTQEKTK